MHRLQEPSSADLQKQVYNRNVGGGLNKRDEFSLPAGTAWAIVGTVVADPVTPDNVPALKAAIEALAEVNTAKALCWGQQPTVEAEDHDAVLAVSARLVQTIDVGGGKSFSKAGQYGRVQILPDAKKWIVWGLVVRDPLDVAGIATLEAAVRAVTGISATEVLCKGATDPEAVSSSRLEVGCHIRIESQEME